MKEPDTDLHSRTLFRIELRLDDLDKRWERNNVLLEEHIKRTEALENRVTPLEAETRKLSVYAKIAGVLLTGGGAVGLIVGFVLKYLHIGG